MLPIFLPESDIFTPVSPFSLWTSTVATCQPLMRGVGDSRPAQAPLGSYCCSIPYSPRWVRNKLSRFSSIWHTLFELALVGTGRASFIGITQVGLSFQKINKNNNNKMKEARGEIILGCWCLSYGNINSSSLMHWVITVKTNLQRPRKWILKICKFPSSGWKIGLEPFRALGL